MPMPLFAVLLTTVIVAPFVAAFGGAVCRMGETIPGHDLDQSALLEEDPALCQQLCEDTEGCAAFVYHPRANGCLPVNVEPTNLPPLWRVLPPPPPRCLLLCRALARRISGPKIRTCSYAPLL